MMDLRAFTALPLFSVQLAELAQLTTAQLCGGATTIKL